MCGIEDNIFGIRIGTRSDGDGCQYADVAEAHYDLDYKQFELEHTDGSYTIIIPSAPVAELYFGKNVKRFTY